MDSTLFRTNGSNPTYDSEKLELKELVKTDYLKSFNSMMEKPKPMSRETLTQREVSFFEEKVFIPNF